MHYGISVPNFGAYFHPRTLANLAHDAEAAGWDGFFIWDHVLFSAFPHADPWVALAAIAMRTERIRIGTMVTPLPRRRPIKLAREAVSIDQLSNGRLILGVGIGAGPWEWEQLGEEPSMRVRGAMLDEGLEVLTGIWSGEPFSHRGEHYTVDVRLPGRSEPAAFEPRPVQSRIPIWVAGFWPNKPPFRRAARWDGVVPLLVGAGPLEITVMTPDALAEIIAYVRRQRADPTAPFDVTAPGKTPGDDPAEGARIVAPFAEAGATWWIEDVSPFRFDWDWQGAWPVEEMNARIRSGPPRVGRGS
jgi:alkanesulfonate monooxygenase SsuD/methylene tetrahydromethanopterin reductase-like flavin-dependent oxidoreductase (luciferase family)